MVDRHPLDPLSVHQISSAVAYVGKIGPFSDGKHRNQRCTHAVHIFIQFGVFIDGGIGDRHSGAQQKIHLLLAHAGAVSAPNLLNENLCRKAACHVAGFGASHAVAYDGEKIMLSELLQQIIILILRTNQTGIGQAPSLHTEQLLSFPPCEITAGCYWFDACCACFFRNCPHEASISLPSVLRTVQATPCSSKSF